jgi:hypothetical protein
MRRIVTSLLVLCVSALFSNFVNAQGDKYAQSAINWSVGPWYNAPTGGDVVSAPAAGDNVFTQGFNVTISSNATCDNITLTSSNSQLTLSSGVTLTVRGLINSTAFSTGVNFFSASHSTSTLRLTGEMAPLVDETGMFLLVSDNATRAVKPGNIIVEAQDTRQYQWAENDQALPPATGQNSISLLGAGKFIVKKGTNLTLKTQLVIGQASTNELVVEDGALLTTRNVRGSFANTHWPGTKATINGVLVHSASSFTIKDIVVGANGRFVTNGGNRWNAWELAWDGWWGAVGITNPVQNGQFATPASVTFAPGATIEFNRTENQNINGVIPANQYKDASSNTFPGTPSTPSYAINYSNIVVSGTNNKVVRSNLVSNGTIEVLSGNLTIPTGVVMVSTGTIINSDAVNVTGALVNANTNNNAMGTISASISPNNEVALLAVPNSGFQFVNWTETSVGEVSNVQNLPVFVPVNGSKRSFTANFITVTGIEKSNLNKSYITVHGKEIRLFGDFYAVQVYNVIGNSIVAEKGVPSISLNDSGIYIVKLFGQNGVSTHKVNVK